MLKKNLLIALTLLLSMTVSGLEVSVSDECSTGESFVSLNDTEGGHAAEPSYYSNKVCVERSQTLEVRDQCKEDEISTLNLFKKNNSHVSTYSNDYLYQVCSKSISTRFNPDTSCRENETKLLSLARDNNSHVASPSYSDSIYDSALCGSYEQPENVTVSLSGVSTPVHADGGQISTGESFVPPVNYPYIASEKPIGIVNYGNFLRLSRPKTDKISMTQRGDGSFLIPNAEGNLSSIEAREDDILERSFLNRISPSFSLEERDKPLVRTVYRFDRKIEVSDSSGRENIKIENMGLEEGELKLKLTR